MASSKGRNDFDEGKAWKYGLFWRDSGQLVESAGLHREDDRDCPESGCWIRTDRTQKGWATESARALVETVFTYLLDVQRVKISVDQANVASAAVPRKLRSHLARVGVRAIEAKSHTGRVFVSIQRRLDQIVRADQPKRAMAIAVARSTTPQDIARSPFSKGASNHGPSITTVSPLVSVIDPSMLRARRRTSRAWLLR